MAERGRAPLLDLNARLPDAAASEFRRAQVRGRFIADWPLYLDNRPHGGVAGRYVLMPFRLAGSDAVVLVLRGWVARDPADRTKLAPLATPPGEIAVQGVVKRDAGHTLQLGAEPPPRAGAIVQDVDLGALRKASGLPVASFVLEQTSEAADGLVRDWPHPAAGVDKHWGYAFQWYALAATAIVFFVVTGFRSARKQT
ncbi:SURF1 family protein [Oxalobacteraceae bacterium OM1]|nr:SURF1 family protein [Oxalobacteraceae bacterium OM1]